MDLDNEIYKSWDASNGFRRSGVSYLYMITHPKKCLRVLNFALKVCLRYGIDPNIPPKGE